MKYLLSWRTLCKRSAAVAVEEPNTAERGAKIKKSERRLTGIVSPLLREK
jgi:hypothetical protein